MSDLSFLKEIREHVEKGQRDVTRHEMALKMLDDWIEELESAQQKRAADGARCTKCGKTSKQHDETFNGHSFDPPRR